MFLMNGEFGLNNQNFINVKVWTGRRGINRQKILHSESTFRLGREKSESILNPNFNPTVYTNLHELTSRNDEKMERYERSVRRRQRNDGRQEIKDSSEDVNVNNSESRYCEMSATGESIEMEYKIETEYVTHNDPDVYPPDVEEPGILNDIRVGKTIPETEDSFSSSPFEYVPMASSPHFSFRPESPSDLGHFPIGKDMKEEGFNSLDTLQSRRIVEERDPLRNVGFDNYIKEEVDEAEYTQERNEDEDPLSQFVIEANVKAEDIREGHKFAEPLIITNGRYHRKASNQKRRKASLRVKSDRASASTKKPVIKTVNKCETSNPKRPREPITPNEDGRNKKRRLNSVSKPEASTPKLNASTQVALEKMVPDIKRKPLKCEICDRCFILPLTFRAHKKLHKGSRKYECETCGKSFSTLPHLIGHGKAHDKEKRYKCETCGKCFTHNYTLTKHKSIHTKVKPHVCDICGVGFARLRSLNVHKTIHIGGTKCGTCGKYFTTRQLLKEHTRVHTRERPHTCDTCGKGFFTSSQLSKHKIYHMNLKPVFKCEICGKGFIVERLLRRHHKEAHTVSSALENPRPYKCETCGKCFTNNSILTRHKSTHTGEKQFACDVCGIRCTTSSSLKEHKKLHTGEKAFECQTCGMKFCNIWRLRAHMKRHTGGKAD